MKNLFTLITIIALIGISLSIKKTRGIMCNNFTYTIKSGDTLRSIAGRFDDKVEDIVRRNNIANPDLIFGNQQIQVCRMQREECSKMSCYWIDLRYYNY